MSSGTVLTHPAPRSKAVFANWQVRALVVLLWGYFGLSAATALLLGRAPDFLDELTIVLLALVAVPSLPSALSISRIRWIVYLLLIFAVFGFSSSMGNPDLGNYPRVQAALLGIALDYKLYIAIISISAIIARIDSRQIRYIIVSICKLFIILGFINLLFCLRDILDGSLDFMGRPLSHRSGFPIPNGIYHHKVNSVFISLLAMISALTYARQTSRINSYIYIMLAIVFYILIAMHLSVKEFVASSFVFLAFFTGGKGAGRIGIVAFIGILAAIVTMSSDNPISSAIFDRLNLFILADSSEPVRTALYNRSFYIANDYFPMGSGSGTFASKPSRDMEYSPIYHLYGISRLYGGYGTLADGGEFLMDAFWPKILAESGWLGFMAYGAVWLIILRAAFVCWQKDRSIATTFGSLLTLATFVIAFATPILTRDDALLPAGLAIAIVLVMSSMSKNMSVASERG